MARLMTMFPFKNTAYLAGPDVFFPNAAEHARRKREICEKYGFAGHTPSDNDVVAPPSKMAEAIYKANVEAMKRCNFCIANLTPFRGPSADPGTVFEIGFMCALNKPVYAYSNSSINFVERTRKFLEVFPDPPGMVIESFQTELCDNLMIAYGVLGAGGLKVITPKSGELPYDSLEMFEAVCASLI